MTTNRELLRQYVEQGDEAAFAELVRRQTDLVYSVALRVSRDPHLAEDVTQAVFTKFAREAGRLRHYITPVCWLHINARHRAIDAIRGEARRRAREQEAVTMQNDQITPPAHWAEIGPLLDEAVERLGERDRQAVLLRFFNGLSHQEVGAILGLSENSANKRVERALEKLRAHFVSRGVTTSASLLASALTMNSVQAAPVGLAKKATAISLAGGGASLAGGTLQALFLAFFMSTKTKIALASVVLVLLVLNFAIKWQDVNERPVSEVPRPPPAPAIAVLPVPTKSPAQVVAPVAPPAPVSEAVVETPAIATQAVASDPRSEIGTAMNDFVNLLQSGDYPLAFDSYLQLPPTMSGQQVMETLQQNPDFPNTIKMMIDATSAAQTETPEYDATGDLATYKLSQPTDGKTMVRWKRINGTWYVDAFE